MKKSFVWKNIGLVGWKHRDAQCFTTEFGIKLRRFVSPAIRSIIGLAATKPYRVVRYPKLDKTKPYIFAAGHSFPGEVEPYVASIDRNAWLLVGTTDQIDHNPKMYMAWLNGMVYVNRLSAASRKDATRKMERILLRGSSVIMFPEGALNNSENTYCSPLYPGVYHLAISTGASVVPIVAQSERGEKEIRIAASEPISFSGMEKEQALDILRDTLSTLRYELCSDYPPLKRSEMQGDIHFRHLQTRRNIYMEVKWIEPNWDEEIVMRRKQGVAFPQDVFGVIDNVRVTKDNAWIIAPILLQNELFRKYDIVRFMKEHWKK
ncbi:MAG: 1-acyl-sn-glycerol-3-phosphate acyltransferase [Lachnospiraceae bacterium]|nr:1-acyl-sn-glycerol-3-phosphate acyltransferase [Lachnospiraceae bacterium]